MSYEEIRSIDQFPSDCARVILIPEGLDPPDPEKSEAVAYVAGIFEQFPRVMGRTGLLEVHESWEPFMDWLLSRDTVHCLSFDTMLYTHVKGSIRLETCQKIFKSGQEHPRQFWNGEEWSYGQIVPVKSKKKFKGITIRLVESPDVITCTKEHVFFHPGGYKVEAQDLYIGEKLKAVPTADPLFRVPEFYTIKAIAVSLCQEYYDVTIDGDPHFALPCGVLSHNSVRGDKIPLVYMGRTNGNYLRYRVDNSVMYTFPPHNPRPIPVEQYHLLIADCSICEYDRIIDLETVDLFRFH